MRENPEQLDELLLRIDELEHIWGKLGLYSKFSETYGSPLISSESPFWSKTIDSPVGKTAIVGLNTTLLSFDDGDVPGNLALGTHQIKEAIYNFPPDTLLFVLMHHPPDWLYDGERLEQILQARPHIILCGHLHQQKGLITSPLHGYGLIRMIAGAGHTGVSETVTHSYSWGRISSNGLDYFPRTWVRELHQFRADKNQYDEMTRDGSIRIVRDKLPPALSNWIPRPDPIYLTGVVEWLNDPRGHWLLTAEGSVEEFDRARQEVILQKVRDLSGDVNVSLVAIAEGSICFVFEGSQEGFNTLSRFYMKDKKSFSNALGIIVLGIEQVKGATLHAGVILDEKQEKIEHEGALLSYIPQH